MMQTNQQAFEKWWNEKRGLIEAVKLLSSDENYRTLCESAFLNGCNNQALRMFDIVGEVQP